jgi:hypothetical protein
LHLDKGNGDCNGDTVETRLLYINLSAADSINKKENAGRIVARFLALTSQAGTDMARNNVLGI